MKSSLAFIFQAKRCQQKSKIRSEAERLEQLLLESLAKENIIKQALGDPEKLNWSPPKLPKLKPSKTEERDDMFKLPPLEDETAREPFKSEVDNGNEDGEDPLCPKRSYDVNINFDVTSAHFKSLPADIRHDILTDIKETRKQNSWARLRELPVEQDDFSTYQMSRLLRRRQVQIGLEEAEKEMGGKCWSLNELETLLSEDGVLEIDKKAQKIASDENVRFLLVRNIAKAMQEAKKEVVARPSTSSGIGLEQSATTDDLHAMHLVSDGDLDLQRAIQLSLGKDPGEVDQESGGRVKLNSQQRQKFGSTIQAHGLIKGFMMEYAEMNGDDVQELIESTQSSAKREELNDSFRKKFPNTDEYVLYGTPQIESGAATTARTANISESSSDDEFVEIPDEKESNCNTVVFTMESDLHNYSQEDDIFADVFETSTQFTAPGIAKELDEKVPDVEVASISSDDDTLPYEIPSNYSNYVDLNKVTEFSFASEEGKQSENADHSTEIVECPPNKFSSRDLSENEKFWADDVIIKIADGPLLITPKKLNREDSPPPAKFASPFFVNHKTPSSKKKSQESTAVSSISVAKSLFSSAPEENAIFLDRAAQGLRKKTSEELMELKDSLVDEQKILAQERNKMDRMGANITESMSRDCKDLLKLFGIPYIESPMEAEAQCAFLNMMKLTDGTISDDSDIWLFGGQTVYKNFFVQKKVVMEFRCENIKQMFNLDRNRMIQLAMLVGSDYTVGIHGVGAVTAMEILAAFPPTPENGNGTDECESLVSSLRKFRDWFQNGKQPGPNGKTVLKSKLKNVELFEGFPNINVARAYLDPTVDSNAEGFSWGVPETELLLEYAKAKLGWTRMKTQEILAPVMKRLNEKKQATIKDYFKSQTIRKFFDKQKLSKRVQKAVGKMGGKDEEEAKQENSKRIRKRKAPSNKKEETVAAVESNNAEDFVVLSSDDDSSAHPAEKKVSPSTSAASSSKVEEIRLFKQQPRKRKTKTEPVTEPITSGAEIKKRAPKIPNTEQVIPQREKDKEEQKKNKQKAVEIFKKSK